MSVYTPTGFEQSAIPDHRSRQQQWLLSRLVEVLGRLPEGGEAVRVHRARLAFPGT